MFLKNSTSREERELEDCGHSVHKNWRGACVKDRCTRKHLQVEPLEKEENEQNHHGFLLIAFSCVMQIRHWNARMNQVRRYFKKRRFTHCVEVVVRITDDIPRLKLIGFSVLPQLSECLAVDGRTASRHRPHCTPGARCSVRFPPRSLVLTVHDASDTILFSEAGHGDPSLLAAGFHDAAHRCRQRYLRRAGSNKRHLEEAVFFAGRTLLQLWQSGCSVSASGGRNSKRRTKSSARSAWQANRGFPLLARETDDEALLALLET